MGARGEVTALLAHAAIHARAVAVALARCETWREMTDECVVAIISVLRCFHHINVQQAREYEFYVCGLLNK